MLSIEECRKLIPDQEKYTDEQILEIERVLNGFADLAFDCWIEERRKKRDDLQCSS
jgi:hypothetical protein